MCGMDVSTDRGAEEDEALSDGRADGEVQTSAGSVGDSGRTAGRRSLHYMYGKL
jgi:hypothetical protein